jgi:capsular polysaccharide export protein
VTRYQTASWSLYRNYRRFFPEGLAYRSLGFGSDAIAVGWGYKKSGMKALRHRRHLLLEDGFVRSLGLGVEGSMPFSIVEDDLGIYYDATRTSRLEQILLNYDFKGDRSLMDRARSAMRQIRELEVSKYNDGLPLDAQMMKRYRLEDRTKRVMVVVQTAGDHSLRYGLADGVRTGRMIEEAREAYPDARIYLKIHPDVLSGRRSSDIRAEEIPEDVILIEKNINPIALLKSMDILYTKTSGMGMEALILGKEVHCYGMPFYAGWGATKDRQKVERRARSLSAEEIFAGAYLLYSRYHDPFNDQFCELSDVLERIARYREIMRSNRGQLYFFGFSTWKRFFVSDFFPPAEKRKPMIRFMRKDADANLVAPENSRIFIWGRRSFPQTERIATEKGLPIYRVEDGFIRSLSLGSDLTRPASLVVDSRGIYFDPSRPSDLEVLLNEKEFDERLLERARKLRRELVEGRVSKYNAFRDERLKLENREGKAPVILVPGQVEDDASILYGADGMGNLELLQAVRNHRSEAYILYKPHPDVLAGNRTGAIARSEALRYADEIVTEASLDAVLDLADEVHTLTSLVGFEALLRGKKVCTYGLPFYAGWGLTEDRRSCPRRCRRRSLDELVAAAYILYPRYVHPTRGTLCEVEAALSIIEKKKKRYNSDRFYKAIVDGRNAVSRRMQKILKGWIGE